NEPNIVGQDLYPDKNSGPAVYAARYKTFYNAIKGADPTATIIGANILNWNTACQSCGGGNLNGVDWFPQFWEAYKQQNNGQTPPADAWGIHAYTIDW